MSAGYSSIKALTEPEAMASFLARHVIGPVLPSVRVNRVRTRPGRRFEAPRILWNVYEAELELPGSVPARPLFWSKAYFEDRDCADYLARIGGLLNELGGNPLDPRGFARFFSDLNLFLFFFPADPVFPALGTVFDGGAMRPLLSPLFRRLNATEPRTIEAAMVKYLPEISAIVRYDTDSADAAPIFGKVQHSRKGAFTFEVMRALWNLPARASGELLMAEPLAYHPELDLLLQSAVAGVEVPGDRHAPAFMAQAEVAGRVIGHIHKSGIELGKDHTVEVELGRLRNRLDEFKLSSPTVFVMIRDLIKQISAQAQRVAPEQPVPSHGDFKYNQFLFDGDRFGLIDVEYFVQAEPSFDLGKYCGHLVPSMPEHWSDTFMANDARRIFLDAYRAVVPEYEGRRFPVYEALSLATRALVVTWSQTTNWEYTAETLVALAYERLKTRWGEG